MNRWIAHGVIERHYWIMQNNEKVHTCRPCAELSANDSLSRVGIFIQDGGQ